MHFFTLRVIFNNSILLVFSTVIVKNFYSLQEYYILASGKIYSFHYKQDWKSGNVTK